MLVAQKGLVGFAADTWLLNPCSSIEWYTVVDWRCRVADNSISNMSLLRCVCCLVGNVACCQKADVDPLVSLNVMALQLLASESHTPMYQTKQGLHLVHPCRSTTGSCPCSTHVWNR